jgi:hypothetical protein
MWLDGQRLAATAKHMPERLDPDHVRWAGRILERYEVVLESLRKWEQRDDGMFELTIVLPADTAVAVLEDWAAMGGDRVP